MEDEKQKELEKRCSCQKERTGKHWLKRMARFVAMVYLLLTIGGCLFYNQMIFPGRHSYRDDSSIVKIQTGDGDRLSARYLHDPNAEFTILFSHGNAEDLGDMQAFMRKLHRLGFSVLAWDYRGYGTSSGSTTVANTCDDIEKIYDYMTNDLNVPPDKIIAMGRSVGGGPTTHLAAGKPLAGVILESTFVSAFRVVTRIPLIPFDKFKNIDLIEEVHCPILIIHGREDTIIPFWHGQKLFDAANEPKDCYWVDGAGHNNLQWVAGPDYWDRINLFVEAIGKEQAGHSPGAMGTIRLVNKKNMTPMSN
ncbi:MAG: alpha/beta hydrolase [Phycisphaerae bacterium]|nr:alpha/beta hydrolase [Phycisphaerae bacterium]